MLRIAPLRSIKTARPVLRYRPGRLLFRYPFFADILFVDCLLPKMAYFLSPGICV